MPAIRTERLDLVAATLAYLEAELESPRRLEALLGARVPEGSLEKNPFYILGS